MRFVNLVSGARLAVRQWGEPGAPALLHLHKAGAAATGAQLLEVGPILAERYGLHVVAPDAPGHGESPALRAHRYRIPALTELVLELLDALGIDEAAVMGNSWGGFLACHVAVAAPGRVRALVLLDSGHVDYVDLPGMADASLEDAVREASAPEWQLRFSGWDEWEAEMRSRYGRWSPVVAESLRAGMREQNGSVVGIAPPEVAGAARFGLVCDRVSTTWPAIAAAGIPVVLLLAGTPGWVVERDAPCVERFRAALPAADVRRMDGWAHDLALEGGPALAEVVGEWLASR